VEDYLTARTIEHAARFLPKAFNDEYFAFYEKELRGCGKSFRHDGAPQAT